MHAAQRFGAGILLIIASSAALAAEGDDKAKQAFITPEEGGIDYQIQGEYDGELDFNGEKFKVGVQVIALGDGQFREVPFLGGLPGDGWTGDSPPSREGKLEGDVVTFPGERVVPKIEKGVFAIYTEDGNKVGELKKRIRESPSLGQKPPEGAVVLFDGTTAENFENGQMTEDGLLKQGVTSKQKFGAHTLHLEFMLSFMPYAREQGRSNSGVYAQGRYETQILDSFGLKGEDNECGGIYKVGRPRVNMCLPPLQWQTYDIDFTPAKFDESGTKTEGARMTVRHNGVLIQDSVRVPNATTSSVLQEGPEPGPVYLQDHGNPVFFRNIWVVEKAEG